MGLAVMLEELYKKNEVPEADQLRLAKDVVLVVPSKDFDATPWLDELGISLCEVAVVWPKETVNMLAEIIKGKPCTPIPEQPEVETGLQPEKAYLDR